MNTDSITNFINTGIGGVLIGWFLKEISEKIKNRGGDKKVLKKLLHALLELQHAALFTNSDKIAKGITSIVESKVGTPFPEEFKTHLKKVYAQQLYTQNSLKIEAIIPEYTKSVTELAAIKPLLAYRLNNHHELIRRTNNLENNIDSLMNPFGLQPGEFKAMLQSDEGYTEFLRPKITEDSIEILQSAAKEVALAIDFITYIKTWLLLKTNSAESIQDELKESIAIDLDDYLINYLQSPQPSTQPAPPPSSPTPSA